jgi:peptidoglycan/LPS O-acetylase OafA/YrhL
VSEVRTESAARWVWPGLIIASTVVFLGIILLDVRGPLRVIVAVWFLAVCPGMAWTRVFGFDDPAARWTVATASSLSIEVLIAAAMAYARSWSVEGAVVALAAVAVVGAIVDLASSWRGASEPRGETR